MLSLREAMDMGLIRDWDTVHFANLYSKKQQRAIEKQAYKCSFKDYDESLKDKRRYAPFGEVHREGNKIIIETTIEDRKIDKSLFEVREFGITAGDPRVRTSKPYGYVVFLYYYDYKIKVNGDLQVDFVGEEEFPVLYLPKHTSYVMS